MKLNCAAVAALAVGLGLGCTSLPQASNARPSIADLDAALSEIDELERKYLLTRFLRTLRPEDMPAVLKKVVEHRVGFEADEVRLLMLAWTRFDAPGAFATARDWPTNWKTVLMEETMQAWGFNNGKAAHAECERVEDEELRRTLCARVITGWVASRDRLDAAEFAATVEEGKLRSRLAFRLAANAGRDGSDAVIEWADAVPVDAPNRFKTSVFFHSAGTVARIDPERAAVWYELRMNEPYTAECLRNVAYNWAKHQDPKTLMPWLEGLALEADRESDRSEAIKSAFQVWVTKAPDDAEEWLVSAALGAGRDEAIEEMAKALIETSPTRAMVWVRQIEDENLKRTRTMRLLRRWSRQDRPGASAWVAEADISSEERQSIQSNLSKTPKAKARMKATADKDADEPRETRKAKRKRRMGKKGENARQSTEAGSEPQA